MMYLGMNQQSGVAIEDMDHIRQSVRDILITPVGTRINRREYGSLLMALIDQPQNSTVKMQVMAATYSALNRWEPRITLSGVSMETTMNGELIVELAGHRASGEQFSIGVPVRGNA